MLSKITPPSPDPRQKALLHGLLSQVIIGTPKLPQKSCWTSWLQTLPWHPPQPFSANSTGDKVILDKLIARITPAPPNPDEQALLEKILSQLTPFSPVYGWGRPEEANFIRSLNRHKLLGICSTVPNNSFFAALPPPPDSVFKQKGGHCDEATLTVEPKIYIAFMVNEGDTLKTANGLMGDGAWIQPERGTVPINWGIDPSLSVTFPR